MPHSIPNAVFFFFGGGRKFFNFLFTEDTNNSHHVSDPSEIASAIKFQQAQKYLLAIFLPGNEEYPLKF